MQEKNKNHFFLFAFGFLLIIIDQWTKIYVKTHFVLGEEINVFGTWFKIHFIENDGMAYGLKFSDAAWAKIILTLIRLFAIAYGIIYWIKNILPKNNTVLNYVIVIIIAGAVGNLIDSLFYGMIFSNSPMIYDMQSPAVFTLHDAYGHFLRGKVVDMIYCPMIRTTLPNWIPLYGGEPYEFFSPVFNFADTCISTGVAILVLFHKRFLPFFNKAKSLEGLKNQ